MAFHNAMDAFVLRDAKGRARHSVRAALGQTYDGAQRTDAPYLWRRYKRMRPCLFEMPTNRSVVLSHYKFETKRNHLANLLFRLWQISANKLTKRLKISGMPERNIQNSQNNVA